MTPCSEYKYPKPAKTPTHKTKTPGQTLAKIKNTKHNTPNTTTHKNTQTKPRKHPKKPKQPQKPPQTQ